MTRNAGAIATPVLVLAGPTAIGKTALSLRIATEFGCEIISMDSMQVYRFMDIGTAKVSREERQRVVHHLVDIVDPDEQYDAARFVRDALAAIESIASRGKIPLLTGGTGLYLSALTRGLFDDIADQEAIRAKLRARLQDEGRAALHRELMACDRESGLRIHLNDTQRLLRGLEIFQVTGIPWSEHLRRQKESASHPVFSRILHLGLTCDREILYERIKLRTIEMMQDDFQKEVASLLAMGYPRDLPAMQSIGYRHMLACLAGEWDRAAATETLIRDTRRYAKRQMTWFGHQQQMQWHDIGKTDKVLQEIAAFLQTT
jgi:tRNA dimethylallyltransferase